MHSHGSISMSFSSQDGYISQEYVPAVVERMRASVFGFDSTEPLDLVQLHWWDVQVCKGILQRAIGV